MLSPTHEGGGGPLSRSLAEAAFSPYAAYDNSDFSMDAFWETYAQIKQSLTASRRLDGFEDYKRFIERLANVANARLVPLKDLMSCPTDGKKTIALRFDIDMEPLAAVRLARHNARHGVPASFFPLHSAYYYGVMRDGVFHRNPLLKEWLKALIVSGCEIGLHTDGLWCYLEHGVDGAAAIAQELAWLRGQGALVHGTAAHNSYPAYNAENFEIFSKYLFRGQAHGSINGKQYPLGILDEAELELSYEANYPVRPGKQQSKPSTDARIHEWCRSTDSNSVESETWMRTYLLDNPCFERAFETIIWHHGGGAWTVATKVNRLLRRRWYWKIGTAKLFRILDGLPTGIRIAFLLHPIYFSSDTTRATLRM